MVIAGIYKMQSLSRIGRKKTMQFSPSFLITIAVHTIYVATINMDDVSTRGKRFIIIYACKIEKYNRKFLYHECENTYYS